MWKRVHKTIGGAARRMRPFHSLYDWPGGLRKGIKGMVKIEKTGISDPLEVNGCLAVASAGLPSLLNMTNVIFSLTGRH